MEGPRKSVDESTGSSLALVYPPRSPTTINDTESCASNADGETFMRLT